MAATIINKAFNYCYCSQNVGRSFVLRNFQKSGSLLSYFTQTRKLNTPKVSRLLSYVGCVEKNSKTLLGKTEIFGSYPTLSMNVIHRKLTGPPVSGNKEMTIDMQTHLLDLFTKDKSLSPKQRDTYMNIIDIVIKSSVDELPDKLKDFASQVSMDELYYLGSTIYSLQDKVGDEAVILAIPLFKLAASSGHMDARYTYGQFLRRGTNGVYPEPVEAANLFTELAKEGHGYAQFALAGMFYSGYGVEQSFEKCHTLYQAAAENEIVQSYNVIGKLYLNGQGVAKDEVEAIKYFLKGDEAGDPQGSMSLGHCYSHGQGVEVDFKKSFEFHMKAADTGYKLGIYNVGTHYFLGKGVDADMSKAAEYFQKASEFGFTLAQVNLGNMYYQGLGVEKDWEKAKELYRCAAPKNKLAESLLRDIEEEEKLKISNT